MADGTHPAPQPQLTWSLRWPGLVYLLLSTSGGMTLIVYQHGVRGGGLVICFLVNLVFDGFALFLLAPKPHNFRHKIPVINAIPPRAWGSLAPSFVPIVVTYVAASWLSPTPLDAYSLYLLAVLGLFGVFGGLPAYERAV